MAGPSATKVALQRWIADLVEEIRELDNQRANLGIRCRQVHRELLEAQKQKVQWDELEANGGRDGT